MACDAKKISFTVCEACGTTTEIHEHSSITFDEKVCEEYSAVAEKGTPV